MLGDFTTRGTLSCHHGTYGISVLIAAGLYDVHKGTVWRGTFIISGVFQGKGTFAYQASLMGVSI